jgi:uncharacterized protein YbaP (TraB family)
MKIRFPAFFFLGLLPAALLLSACGGSSNEQKVESSVYEPRETDRIGHLWRITGPGVADTAYLLGTFHLLCPAEMRIPARVERALRSQEQVLMELDFDDPTLGQKLGRVMNMDQGRRLKDVLRGDQYDKLYFFFRDSLGVRLSDVSTLKPFFLNAMMLGAFLDCDHPVSHEQRLAELASERNVPVHGLETPGEQISFFDSIGYVQQAKWVVSSVEHYQRTRREYRLMKEAYESGNVDKLFRVYEHHSRSTPRLLEFSLLRRNRAWVEEIVRRIQERPTFVAVGAAHLGGPDGLLRLLEEAGLTVAAVRPKEAA